MSGGLDSVYHYALPVTNAFRALQAPAWRPEEVYFYSGGAKPAPKELFGPANQIVCS